MIRRSFLAATVAAAVLACSAGDVRAQQPKELTIGFGMALTGGLAAIGKTGLLAIQIWRDDVNAKGGILGRPVKLVWYDDQSNPSTVPGIYTKLLDVDKVDFIVSGYATNQVAPAIPVAMAQNKLLLGLFALAANHEFHYKNYFSMLPTGADPKVDFSKGFFDVAMQTNPKPTTLAIVGADAEFPKNAIDGARDNAKKHGLKIVYDRTYPPPTTDFTPIVRAIQASNPDVLYIASYPPDSIGMLRAINEIGFKAKVVGGGMVGLQVTSVKQNLGTQLNGIVNYDWWVPAANMQYPGMDAFLKAYQAKAPGEGIDPLGYYLPPFAYANMQILGEAITQTKSMDHQVVADYIRKTTFKTLIGDIKYGKDGEWDKPRVLMLQYRNIKGNDIEQFRTMAHQAVLDPPEYKSDAIAAPFVPEGKK